MQGSSKKYLMIAIVVLLIGIVAGGRYLVRGRAERQIAVIIPTLSSEATLGEAVFAANCAVCHGKNAAGADKGPPLINSIYNPSHHGDFSFVRAVTLGVPQHHWLYGPMPAQPQIQRSQIEQIVAYVRELQRANGIR